MNDLQFRQQVLDTKSASWCAAKWYNSTIWLGSGQTTSCHHPLPHAIDPVAIQHNPSAIHNTQHKKLERQQMQRGQRPAGCEYCWKIEDIGRDNISDRVYKSKIYSLTDLTHAHEAPADADINLRTLEIAFDRTCQFACSYCNPAFSTTWVRDIKQNGAYQHLTSDGRNHYTHAHDRSQLYRVGQTNPYVEAFFAWWETDLHRTLQELRITGGEPLMSADTWKLIDWFKTNQGRSQTRLAINSNLGMDNDRLQEFLDRVQDIPHLEIYTSMESVDQHAEYIRDGLNYQQWTNNVHELLESPAIQAVHCMATVNALCLEHLPALMYQLLELKQMYGRQRVSFTLNILRFPSFQSALILPDTDKHHHRDRLQDFWNRNQHNPYLHEHELNHIQRLIDYLDVVKTPHVDAVDLPRLQQDFRQFFTQYDQRRGKNFVTTFPALADWYTTL